jgi:hypothetical protein
MQNRGRCKVDLRLLDDLGSSINDFSVAGVHITNPLEQIHGTGMSDLL